MSDRQPTWVLASDVDNTLTGDAPALQRLAQQLQTLRRESDLFLILSTGRRLTQVLDGFAAEGLPECDAIVSQVGTEIYLPPFKRDMAPLAEWDRRLHQDFSRRRALSYLQDVEGLEMQPAPNNTPLKVSAFLDQVPDPEAAVSAIRQRIAAAGNADVYQVVWSSGVDLDVIPAAAGKGHAIRFLLQHLGLRPQSVIVAGDSGNDLSMFETFSQGIVVANAQPELKELREDGQPGHYFADSSFAAGVAEGLRHFGVLGR